MASALLGSTSSRPVRACTECKQAKLKCDSKTTFPNSCSRCHERQLLCLVDSSFRRTPARKRVESMRKELEQLRNQKNISAPGAGSESTLESDNSTNLAQQGGVEPNHNFELTGSEVSLDGTIVDATLAVEALKMFADLFLPQFPITGAISAAYLYTRCPLLFWTMLIIVFSHHRDMLSDSLYEPLTQSYVRRLQREITDAPLPLFKIHVLLLLTMWPLPVVAQARDPGWLYCGIATQASRYMGLDRDQTVPSLCSLGVVAGPLDTRINTWIGCFYATTSLSLQLGLRPLIDADLDLTTIQSFLARRTFNHEFETLVRVQIIVAKYSSLLSHTFNQDGYASIMRLIESELDVLLGSCQETGNITQNIRFSMLDVKLHFHAFLMTKLSSESPSQQITVKTGLATALRLVSISNMPQRSGPPTDDAWLLQRRRSLPKNYYRGLAFATILLLKFFYLNSATPKEEQQAAATHIGIAQNIFTSCSFQEKDEYARTAHVFESLSRLREGKFNPTMKLRLTHLMGVSILFDAVSTAAEIRGRPVELDENEAQYEDNAALYGQMNGQQSLQNASYSPGQLDPTMEFFTEFWDGPLPQMTFDDLML